MRHNSLSLFQRQASLLVRRQVIVWFWVLGVTIGSFFMLTQIAAAEDVQTVATENDRYEFRADHDPNGIGKFYLGREIAHVMGHPAAIWLERPEREQEEGLSLLMKLLELKPGMVVADIGAGSGVLTLQMAPRVAPGGKVIAVDIQQEMLARLQNRMRRTNIENVDLLLGSEKSPELEPETVDLILLVDVYHEFEFPYEMAQNMAAALKPGGRIALVEYRLEDPRVPIKLVHKMSEKQSVKELTQPGLNLVHTKTIDKLPRQHLMIFTRRAE